MNWTILFRWVLANFLGGVVGYLAGLLFALVVGGFSLLFGGVIGAVIGLAQWQVLRDYMEEMRAVSWISFSALGFGLSVPALSYLGYGIAFATGLETGGDPVQGWINLASSRGPNGPVEAMLALVGRFPSALIGAAIVGALAGAVIGTAQLVVLRRHSQWAYWWVPATAIAGLVGTIAALYVSIGVYNGLYDENALFIVSIALSPAGISILGSVVTGLVLARLVERKTHRAQP